MGFVAVVEAKEGLLLGGVKKHRSSAFEEKEHAQSWAKTVCQSNVAAGRKLSFVTFYEVNYVEIRKEEVND